VQDFLQRRAGQLIVASWVVALFVWWSQSELIDLIKYWIYCWPTAMSAEAWRFQLSAIPVAKVANFCLPVAATAFFPARRFQAGRVAALAILVSVLIWLGFAAWIASHYYPS